jgi:hypothetical protein
LSEAPVVVIVEGFMEDVIGFAVDRVVVAVDFVVDFVVDVVVVVVVVVVVTVGKASSVPANPIC